MFNLEDFKQNPVTGSMECNFNGKLLSINEDTVLENKNGTMYRIAQVEFKNSNGDLEKTSVQLYESNYEKGLEIGQTYICTMVITDREEPLLFISPLIASAKRAKISSFGSIAKQLQEKAAKAAAGVIETETEIV